MTGFMSPGENQLSLLTIGLMEDLGYVVNRDAADEFSAADINPACRCDGQPDRQLRGNEFVKTEQKERKMQSTEERDYAIGWGKNRMKKYENIAASYENPTWGKYVGDQALFVMYREKDGSVGGVVVTSSE